MVKKEDKKIKGDKRKEETLIRILSTDIPGERTVYSGLAKIKGVSWSFSNAVCKALGIGRDKKIKDLTEKKIKKISEFIKNPKLPSFILNRRKDFSSGQNKHLVTSDLNLEKEFDVKRLRKIKSYRGLRHLLGQPVRGQRTKAHFRKHKAVGVTKRKIRKSGK